MIYLPGNVQADTLRVNIDMNAPLSTDYMGNRGRSAPVRASLSVAFWIKRRWFGRSGKTLHILGCQFFIEHPMSHRQLVGRTTSE